MLKRIRLRSVSFVSLALSHSLSTTSTVHAYLLLYLRSNSYVLKNGDFSCTCIILCFLSLESLKTVHDDFLYSNAVLAHRFGLK